MVCRKMIIGFYGLCDCEICFPKDPLLYKKLSEKYISEINAAIKSLENDIEDNVECKYCTISMCKYCFDEIAKEREKTEEETENISDDIKQMKDTKPPHPGKVAHELLAEICRDYYGASLHRNVKVISKHLQFEEHLLDDFFNGGASVGYVLAYKLSKLIKETDIRFWMDLQEKYDEHMEKNK